MPTKEGLRRSEDDGSSASPAVRRLNGATYEELRAHGLSFTQTGHVLVYRESVGAFGSLDELDRMPGFSAELLAELKRELAEGEDGEFRWSARPADAGRARRGVKYRVAFGGGWRAKFDTLAEALDYAEAKAPRLSGDIVYVVRSGPLRKQFVTAYPQSQLEFARERWAYSQVSGASGGG